MLNFRDLINKLKSTIVIKEGPTAQFQRNAYNNVIRILQEVQDLDELATEDKIDQLSLTTHMKKKLIELSKSSKKGQKKEIRPPLYEQLITIAGIGPAMAKNLIQKGLKNISDLRKPQWFQILPKSIQIFIKYDTNRKIPHENMKALEPVITGFKRKTGSEIILTGSYRRKTPFSRDFDIMLVSDNPSDLDKYEEYLRKHWPVYVYAKGTDRVSLLVEVDPNTIYKFDLFRTSKANKYGMLLYSTGPKLFNIKMRKRAKKMGLLLNQNGLFDNEKKLNIRSEKGFFNALKMDYLPPESR